MSTASSILGVALCGTLLLHAAPPPKTSAKVSKDTNAPVKTSSKAVKKAPVKKTFPKRLPVVRSRVVRAPRPPAVSASTRAEAHEGILKKVAGGAEVPFENSAALVPFFEQLYRGQKGELSGPVHILHYGDSHTAADELTGGMRDHFQQAFGDGGAGFSEAGRPWNSYRRLDVKSGSTKGWYSDGLMGRTGDGRYGLGGVSMTTQRPRESVFLIADGQRFELFYLQQPGGGSIAVYDNGILIDQVSTNGDAQPAYLQYASDPGTHRLEVQTLDPAPVRLFGWVSEKASGITYEQLGINGAEAPMMLNWDADILRSNLERRKPALIVLAFGTNEAGHRDLTLEAYRDQFSNVIERLRSAAPTATILVLGPPDREVYMRNPGSRTRTWVAMDGIDKIIEAQREAALSAGCVFWDQREKMGGKGAMQQWVQAGMGQYDHVHFTAPGYRMLADALYRDLMSQYAIFLKARDAVATAAPARSSESVLH